MKLSIAVITMNRSGQLIDALMSCIKCPLPADTQFVIIDNNSADNTDIAVKDFFADHPYCYYYEKMSENLGVGIGRNYAFSKSEGEYVYFLDDDAFVDTENNGSFFDSAISILDDDSRIMTLTTQIYDLMWKANRVEKGGPMISEGIYKCYRFCGGSHFLRRSFFGQNAPYFPNKYGLEEIFPSLRVMDAGGLNVFVEDLLVYHNPKVNKWHMSEEQSQAMLVVEVASKYAMKSAIYPIVTVPILYTAYLLRCKRSLSKDSRKKTQGLINETKKKTRGTKRIMLSTVLSMYKDFGSTIF